MDDWSHSQILAMLEGGNDRLKHFYNRYSPQQNNFDSKNVGNSNRMLQYEKRYNSKASQLYRDLLTKHVNKLISKGECTGRGIKKSSNSKRKKHKKSGKKCENPSNLLI